MGSPRLRPFGSEEEALSGVWLAATVAVVGMLLCVVHRGSAGVTPGGGIHLRRPDLAGSLPRSRALDASGLMAARPWLMGHEVLVGTGAGSRDASLLWLL